MVLSSRRPRQPRLSARKICADIVQAPRPPSSDLFRPDDKRHLRSSKASFLLNDDVLTIPMSAFCNQFR